MRIEKAHLYVEKYNKDKNEILLDFVDEAEFIYFKNIGDYNGNEKLNPPFEPTMLLINNFVSNRKISEGNILTVDMDKLINIRKHYKEDIDENKSAVSFMVFDDSNLEENAHKYYFSNIIENDCHISNYISKSFINQIESSWKNGSPCALEYLSDYFELQIWNVEQGNTNCIYDDKNLTFFDFGASCYASNSQLCNIIKSHQSLFKDKCISIIISHWDVDHYNLLCVAEDNFFKSICCVFYPNEAITLTSKQIIRRMENNCAYRCSIAPSKRSTYKKCGITEICSGNNYILFSGEASSSTNRSGLLLAVYNEYNTFLLTADHSNYQVWNNMYNSIKSLNNKLHIVIPHHGGNCGALNIPNITTPGIAAISVGANNYGHPKKDVLLKYDKFIVKRTDKDKDITIP